MLTTARSARRRALMPLWLAVIVAAAAGWLMDLAYPSVAAWVLAFPATGLLLAALIGRRAGGALLVGLVYGGVFFLLLVSWTSRYLGPIPWAALATVEGGLTAIGVIPIALAYRWVPRILPGRWGRMLVLPAIVAALWVGREVVLGAWPYGGFPWARIGMTQSTSPLATVSSWVGVSGLGFLMVMLTAMVVELVRLRSWREFRSLRGAVPTLMPVAVAVLLVVMPAFPTTTTGALRIAAVQGNGPTGYFDERTPFSVVQAQTEATQPLYGEDVDLLVWPEGGLDTDPFTNSNLARRLTLVANRIDAPVLANAATARGDEYFNTSMLWQQDGTATQLHDKRHPVPFGEYVPDRAFYAALVPDLVGLIQREYSFGQNPPIVDVDGTKVGLAICFDVVYDDVIHEGIRDGAEVLVFQTNNADFRGTDENQQQLAFARMRAIETGRSVVNISTVGASQIIRPDGSTQQRLNVDEAGALLDDVELRSGLTPGALLGSGVSQLLLWGGLAALVISPILERLMLRRRGAQAPIF